MMRKRGELYIILRIDLQGLHPTLRRITFAINGKGFGHLAEVCVEYPVQPLFPSCRKRFIRSRDHRVHIGFYHRIKLAVHMVGRSVVQSPVNAVGHDPVQTHHIRYVIGDTAGIEIGLAVHACIP